MSNSYSTRFLIRIAMSESRPSSMSGTSAGRSSGEYPIDSATTILRRSSRLCEPFGSHLSPASSTTSARDSIGALVLTGALTTSSGSGSPDVTTASKSRRNVAPSRACTCTDAPPGCGLSVVVRVAAPASSPWGTAAVRATSESTCPAAALTSTARSVTADASTSHTWRPSGRATCEPGTRAEPPALTRMSSQYGLRRNAVRGTEAKSPAGSRDSRFTAWPCTYSCARAARTPADSSSLRLSVWMSSMSCRPESKAVAATDISVTGLGASSTKVVWPWATAPRTALVKYTLWRRPLTQYAS